MQGSLLNSEYMIVPVLKRLLSTWQARPTMGNKTDANRDKISHLRSSHRSKTKLRVKSTLLALLPPAGYWCAASLQATGKRTGKIPKKPAELLLHFLTRQMTQFKLACLVPDHGKITTVQNEHCNSLCFGLCTFSQ